MRDTKRVEGTLYIIIWIGGLDIIKGCECFGRSPAGTESTTVRSIEMNHRIRILQRCREMRDVNVNPLILLVTSRYC